MKRIEICCPDCFAHNLIDILEFVKTDEFDLPMVTVYGDYEIIKHILESLIRCDVNIDLGIELEDYDFSGYVREYVLSLSKEGVCVEKLWHETDTFNGYYGSESNVAFVHEDCNSKLLNSIDSDLVIEFGYKESEESDEKKDHEYKDDPKDNINDKDDYDLEITNEDGNNGFTVSKTDDNGYRSFSYYTTGKLSKNKIDKLIKKLGF